MEEFLASRTWKQTPTSRRTYETEKAEENASKAEIIINGAQLSVVASHESFRVLGVDFTAELDWTAQKRVAGGKFGGALNNLVKRAVTDIQLIEIINVMLLSALTYHMAVVPYSENELNELEKRLHGALRRRMRITDPSGWADWMTLRREEGGFGLYSIKDLHDACQINSLYIVLVLHPDQDMLMQHC